MAAVPDALQQIDSWPGIVVAVSAAVAAVLVPLTGFLKTFFDYRIEATKAEKQLRPEVARDVASGAGTALFNSMEVSDLTAAIKELTAAIRADTASDEAHHASQFAQVLERLTAALDRQEAGHDPPPNRRR